MGTVEIHPPKTPVTKGSNTVAAATVPNVCKMPGPPAPFVPAPLPNIAKSSSSPKDFSKKVTFDGKNVAIKGATFKSMGDVASKGTGGGLVSSNTHGPAKFVTPGSMSVKVEGKSVHLLAEPMLNNCGGSGNPPNSATLMGGIHKPGGGPVTADEPLCHWCGKALAGHESIKTDDKEMIGEAHSNPKGGSGKTVGAMKVGDGPAMTSRCGGGDGLLYNLKAKALIPLKPAQKAALEAKGNGLGNCCEQKMLRKEFITNAKPFPPPGGLTSIQMGIDDSIGGKPSKSEIRAAKKKKKKKPKCGTCDAALKMMFCTDEQKPPGGEG